MTDVINCKVCGKNYKFVYPGAAKAIKIKEDAINKLVFDENDTTRMVTDKSKLFDFFFGVDRGSEKYVTYDGADHESNWIDWRSASPFEKKGGIPTVQELEEVWASLLPLFLSGKLEDVSERKGIKKEDIVVWDRPVNNTTNSKSK